MQARNTTTGPRGQRGVTVAELVLVAVMVGGLLLVAYTSARNIRRETATSDCQTQLRTLKLATEQFHAQNDTYPDDNQVLESAKLVKASEIELWAVSYHAGDAAPTYTAAGRECIKVAAP